MAINVLWMSKIMEQCHKQRKMMNDSLLQLFWKNNSKPLSTSSPIIPSFLVCFEWLKTWWICQLSLYKISLYFKSKDATIKDLKFEILIYFNLPIIQHQTPLHQTPHIFPILLLNWTIFVALEALGGKL